MMDFKSIREASSAQQEGIYFAMSKDEANFIKAITRPTGLGETKSKVLLTELYGDAMTGVAPTKTLRPKSYTVRRTITSAKLDLFKSEDIKKRGITDFHAGKIESGNIFVPLYFELRAKSFGVTAPTEQQIIDATYEPIYDFYNLMQGEIEILKCATSSIFSKFPISNFNTKNRTDIKDSSYEIFDAKMLPSDSLITGVVDFTGLTVPANTVLELVMAGMEAQPLI